MIPLVKRAGADWAFISDASALVIGEELEPASSTCPLPRIRVSAVEEIRNDGGPRDPVVVAERFAGTLRKHGVDRLASDGHYRASWEPVLASAGIDWIPAPVKADDIAQTFLMLRVLLHADRLDLPPSARLKRQIAELQSKATHGAGIAVTSKRRKDADGGTSHGDIVSALVLVVWQFTQGAEDYRHSGVAARGASSDPRTRGAKVEQCYAGIPKGEYQEFAEVE